MSLTKFNGETNNIQGLADKPTQTASQLKTLFDKTGDDLKTYINGTLTAEIDTELEKKANNSNVYSKAEADTLLGEKANSVDVYTKAQSNTNFKANGDFAVISGTHQFDGVTKFFTISYPSGFTNNNSVIISVGTDYKIPNINVFLDANYIRVLQDEKLAEFFKYKIVLMKV